MKYLFLTLGLISTLSAHAQQGGVVDYFPEGKTWHYCQYMPEYRESDITIAGETTVNGLVYKKLVFGLGTSKEHAEGYLRQDGHKVYSPGINGAPDLVYDYSMKVGDSITDPDQGGEIFIQRVDTILSMGHRYQRQILGLADYDGYIHEEPWVEGIGSTHEPTLPYNFNTPGSPYILLWVSVNGEQVYNSDSVSVITGIPQERIGVTASAPRLYDLSGRRIGTPRPGQVYIKDGRKRMETR